MMVTFLGVDVAVERPSYAIIRIGCNREAYSFHANTVSGVKSGYHG